MPGAPLTVRFSLGLAVLLVGTAPALAPVVPVAETRVVPPRNHWIDASPRTPGEHELAEAVAAGPARPEVRAALARVAEAHPGTAVGGLAHLARGLALLDLDEAEEALAPLGHPDIDHTHLEDHALLARARANERAGRYHAAAEAYATLVRLGDKTPFRCVSHLRGGEVMSLVGRTAEAVAMLEASLAACPGQVPATLQAIAEAHQRAGDLAATAAALDRLLGEHPLSAEAKEEASHAKKVAAHFPRHDAATVAGREARKGLALVEAGRHKEAIPVLRAALARGQPADTADLLRVRLARASLEAGREKDALPLLRAVRAGSPHEAEAAYHAARIAARRPSGVAAYETVAARFAGTGWGEEALLDLAHHHVKDGRDAEALPYYRRIAEEYPRGRYHDAALWRVGWEDYRAGRHREAAERFERATRERPDSLYAPAFLYWSGRARQKAGDDGLARERLVETVRRYKHLYHGQRAAEALGEDAAEVGPEPVAAEDPALLPDPVQEARVRHLLLIGRLDAALEELAALPPGPQAQATRALILHRQGKWRAAINAMRRAYPESQGAAGDHLPGEVWRVLYPLAFAEELDEEARQNGLDPALVAALIWQESTFDPGAVSGAGARGLMQLMPRTGRELARRAGIRKFEVSVLHDPGHGLDLGTRYLRGMVDAFGGRLEWALAAYNAGPRRVEIWSGARGRQPAEEFVESIPFQETRRYVMSILANREHYRRLYGLGSRPSTERERIAD